MEKYKIRIKPSALKELDPIPKKIAQQIIKKIGHLADQPRMPGSQKLSGDERYRLRQGDYRILYSINDSKTLVEVVKIAHRREVYRQVHNV